MKTRGFFPFVILCIFTFQHSPLHSQTEVTVEDFPAVELEHSQIRILHSNIIKQDFELLISLPRSYYTKDAVYPVIYLLDPYRTFSMVKGFTDAMTAPSQLIQETILVGIGYGGEGLEARMNWALGRVRDYTPVQNTETEEWYEEAIKSAGMPDTEITSGGAQWFLEFLDKELIPFIESNYRAKGQSRMLSGYSFGGLFGMYALFHKPELFNKYFIGSPSIHYGDDITFANENSYATSHTDLDAEVFISAGELEERTSANIMKMEQLLLSRGYKNLSLKTVIFDNENHYSCYPAAMSRGLFELLGEHNDNVSQKNIPMSPQIIPFEVGINTSYIIKYDNAILVDGAPFKDSSLFLEVLEKNNMNPEEIKLIVLTHGDFDHVGGAKELRGITGAKIAIHKNDRENLEKGIFHWPEGVTAWGKFSRAMFKPFLKNKVAIPTAKVDIVLDDEGLSLEEYGIPGRILYTPGHTYGSVSVLLETGDAFIGCLAHNKFPFVTKPRLPIYAKDIDLLKESWLTVIDQGALTIYPGHGKSFPVEKIQKYLK